MTILSLKQALCIYADALMNAYVALCHGSWNAYVAFIQQIFIFKKAFGDVLSKITKTFFKQSSSSSFIANALINAYVSLYQ